MKNLGLGWLVALRLILFPSNRYRHPIDYATAE
jgi:hypothetical protein